MFASLSRKLAVTNPTTSGVVPALSASTPRERLAVTLSERVRRPHLHRHGDWYLWQHDTHDDVRTLENMKRVVIIGRGASGKSTLAARLGEITGLPVIELDKVFWRPGLVATPRDQWVVVQEGFVAEEGWIIDGDLGP